MPKVITEWQTDIIGWKTGVRKCQTDISEWKTDAKKRLYDTVY